MSGSQRKFVSAATLTQLAAITGTDCDHERARIAVQSAASIHEEPLAQLVAAAAEANMKITTVRLPLAEVVWNASHDLPVILWNPMEAKWVVVTFAGWFRVRVADGDHPAHRITISRGTLVEMTGAQGLDQVIEAGIVHPERPFEREDSGALHHEHAKPHQRFFQLLRAERRDIATLLIFSFVSGILYLAAPLAVDAVVSNLAFGGQSRPYVQAIVILALALLGALGLQAVVSGFQYYLSDIIQRRIFVRASADLAYRLPRVKAEALDEVHAPELVNRFLDVVTAQKSTSLLLLDGVNLVFSSLIGMLLLALYHPLMLMFVAVLLLLISLSMWILGKGAVKTSIAESRVKYEVVNWFEEIAAFPFAFKGPGGYQMATSRANHLAIEYLTRRSAHFRVVMRQIVALLTLSVVASAALLILGGWLVVSQQITLGQLVASELIMGTIVAAMAKMGKKLEAWYDAMAAMDKLGHILDLEIEREDGERPAQRVGAAEVAADDLSFGYLGPLFANKSFVVPPGSRTAIIGPHGAGTSSLLDIIFGLRQPMEGHVSVDGLDLRSWYLEALRESAMLLRRDEIIDGTIVENLRLGRDDVGLDEVRGALDRVGLLKMVLDRPEGLSLRLKVGGAPLSGNQRTRLLLARALVQRPRLLLIDELFDSLDDESFRLLSNAILDRSIGWTVILATRDHDVILHCDQVIELAPCHLNDGTASQLVTERSQHVS